MEILNCSFAFQQGVDQKGKATTRVHAGTINITLSQLPPQDIIEWGLKSRSYKDGAIIMLDNENMPMEKIIFQNAACVDFEMDYTQANDSYATTRIVIQAEILIVGDGIDFLNEWTSR